jgi:hypothetical protein
VGNPLLSKFKKNGTVRFLTDFRKLNSKIRRKVYPVPKISDILQFLQGLKYASTTLDLDMMGAV